MAYVKSDRETFTRSISIRLTVLILVLDMSTFLAIKHQFSKGWVPPGVDAFCPFGGIESAVSLIATGTMIRRIAWSSFTLLLAVMLVVVLFRRSFCGCARFPRSGYRGYYHGWLYRRLRVEDENHNGACGRGRDIQSR